MICRIRQDTITERMEMTRSVQPTVTIMPRQERITWCMREQETTRYMETMEMTLCTEKKETISCMEETGMMY